MNIDKYIINNLITITRVKRDSDCNRNEKDNSEKQLGGEGEGRGGVNNNKIYMKNILGNLQDSGKRGGIKQLI